MNIFEKMDGLVSFKIYYNPVEEDRQEVRRFAIDSDVVTSFLYLREKILGLFPDLRERRWTLFWKDEEDDDVIISSDEDLQIYLNEVGRIPVKKLFIRSWSNNGIDVHFEITPKTTGPFHDGIVCDGCEKPVQGFRYKCIQCPDYDLCMECEGRGQHAEHSMLRLSVPVQWKPHYGKRLAHHMNRFVRKAASNNLNATCGEEGTSRCPFKDFKEEKKEEKREAKCHGRRRKHCSNDGPTWIDSVSAFLNDWANLPGECPAKADNNPSRTAEDKDENGARGSELLKLIGDMKRLGDLSKFLDPLGIDVNFQVKTDGASGAAGTSNGTAAPKKDEETGKKEEKKEEEKKEESSAADKSSASDETKDKNMPSENEKSPSPAPSTSSVISIPAIDGADWTIISQPKERSGSNGAIPKAIPIRPSSPIDEAKPTPPIYPPLPKTEVPLIHHPNAAINSAVHSMIQMGFTNDGGWLTNLLIAHKGDISRALDALQPVMKS